MLLRATHFLSLRGIANGDAVAISRKGILFIKPKTINSVFIRFHQLPQLFNTTIYQYVIIQSVVIYESKSVLLTA